MKQTRLLILSGLTTILLCFSMGSIASSARFTGTSPLQYYLQAEAGPTWISDTFLVNPGLALGYKLDYKVGYNAGAQLGIKYGSWRSDVNFIYSRNSLDKYNGISDKGHNYSLGYFLNGYYDIPLTEKWLPYFGIGIGFVYTNAQANLTTNTDYKGNSTRFSYNGVIGLSYLVNNNLRIFAQYMRVFINYSDKPAGFSTDFKAYSNGNLLSIGLGYYF